MFGIGRLIGALVTIVAVSGGLYFGSAWIAAANTLQALQNADAAALARQVDVEAVRENLKQDMVRAAQNRAALGGLEGLAGLAGLGLSTGAASLADSVLSRALTPETMAKALASQRPADAKTYGFPELVGGAAVRGRFEGQDRFNLPIEGGDGTTYLIFARRNLIGWAVVDVEGDFRLPGA